MESCEPGQELATELFEFRWDVEVSEAGRGYGNRFMKQWRRILQAQKMAALVSRTIAPQRARFQLCVGQEVAGESVSQREREVTRELSRLRWPTATPEESIEGQPAGTHPAGWEGVRIWIAFARQDVETALGKKPKI